MLMNVIEIQKIIPHRFPFLLVDGILELDPAKRIVGIKNVTVNEPFFQGHFPGAPVMPGVLIVEAMAQVAAVMVLKELPDREQKLVYFSGIDRARFRQPVKRLSKTNWWQKRKSSPPSWIGENRWAFIPPPSSAPKPHWLRM